MTVRIVFESMSSHPADLAESVASGLRSRGVDAVVQRAGSPGHHEQPGADPLVLTAPTPALSLSREASRADAVEQGADPSAATGLRGTGDDVPDRTSFCVEHVTGPLLAGERERAQAWGRGLPAAGSERPAGPRADA